METATEWSRDRVADRVAHNRLGEPDSLALTREPPSLTDEPLQLTQNGKLGSACQMREEPWINDNPRDRRQLQQLTRLVAQRGKAGPDPLDDCHGDEVRIPALRRCHACRRHLDKVALDPFIEQLQKMPRIARRSLHECAPETGIHATGRALLKQERVRGREPERRDLHGSEGRVVRQLERCFHRCIRTMEGQQDDDTLVRELLQGGCEESSIVSISAAEVVDGQEGPSAASARSRPHRQCLQKLRVTVTRRGMSGTSKRQTQTPQQPFHRVKSNRQDWPRPRARQVLAVLQEPCESHTAIPAEGESVHGV